MKLVVKPGVDEESLALNEVKEEKGSGEGVGAEAGKAVEEEKKEEVSTESVMRPSIMPDSSGNIEAEKDKHAYGFAMLHKDVIPQSFIETHCYDETKVNFDPSKALLDVNPH